MKLVAQILVWILLVASTFLACRSDQRRFESMIAFQKGVTLTVWRRQVTLLSIDLATPGPVETIEFSPPTKSYEGVDLPIGRLGNDPGQMGNGKPFELINNESTLRVYARIDHPDPPNEVELQVWRADHSGEKFKVVIESTYYQSFDSFLSDYLIVERKRLEGEQRK